jgi:hypothetical protein
MAAAEAQNEPTMEEILASIRRIIADDDAPAGGAEPAAAQDDVLDLTEFAEPEPEPAAAEAFDPFDDAPVDSAPPQVIEDLMILDREEPAPAPAPVAAPVGEALLAAPAAAAASSAFSRLSSLGAAPVAAAGIGGMTVEALARELLRPMLKEWLDANLPGIVEAAVEAEVARVAGRR